MKLEARTKTAESEDFDLILEGGAVRIELDRTAAGTWRFWNVAFASGERFGGTQTLGPDVASWLESLVENTDKRTGS